jgi:hypothetical protein
MLMIVMIDADVDIDRSFCCFCMSTTSTTTTIIKINNKICNNKNVCRLPARRLIYIIYLAIGMASD